MHRLYCLLVVSLSLANIFKLLPARLLAWSLEGFLFVYLFICLPIHLFIFLFLDVHLVELSFMDPKRCVFSVESQAHIFT